MADGLGESMQQIRGDSSGTGTAGCRCGGLRYVEEAPAGWGGDLEGKSSASCVLCGAAEWVVEPFSDHEGAGAGAGF